MATATGLSVSEFLRRRAFGVQVAAAAEAIVRSEVRVALRKIGANVNQLARRAQEAGPLVSAERAAVAVAEEAEAALVEIKQATDAIKTTGRREAQRSAPSALLPLAGASDGAGGAGGSRAPRPMSDLGGAADGAPDGGRRRALTHSRGSASEAGLDLASYEGEAVPEGSWVGRLDSKVWTKTGMGVSRYFTREDEARGGARGEASERTSNGLRGVARAEATEGSAARARDSVSGAASVGSGDGVPLGAPERYRLAAFRASCGGLRIPRATGPSTSPTTRSPRATASS